MKTHRCTEKIHITPILILGLFTSKNEMIEVMATVGRNHNRPLIEGRKDSQNNLSSEPPRNPRFSCVLKVSNILKYKNIFFNLTMA